MVKLCILLKFILITFTQATLSFDGAVAGSILGVFTLGIFVPCANSVVNCFY
jgi:hypothetical protein